MKTFDFLEGNIYKHMMMRDGPPVVSWGLMSC